MFLYLNFRKNAGLVASHGFHKEEKVAPFLLDEVKALIRNVKNDYINQKDCPSSKELEDFIDGLNKPTITDLKELIKRYEKWAEPMIGPCLIHDIQEHSLVKDN